MLRLHAGDALHPAIRRFGRCVVQQRRFADALLAAYDQRTAMPSDDVRDESVELGTLGFAASQARRTPDCLRGPWHTRCPGHDWSPPVRFVRIACNYGTRLLAVCLRASRDDYPAGDATAGARGAG